MKKSIITDDMEHCYLCGRSNPEKHHVFYGTANRKLSDRYGLVVPLCYLHHRGVGGVHFNPQLDDMLKGIAEERFCEEYPYDFRRLFYGDGIEVVDEQFR